jgi:gamma-glutamylcyclotransferase (GGCT)/AIG2-like uncharacterized protein YtfP
MYRGVLMDDRLFVYGTLAPGKPNAHVLSGVPGHWENGTVRGRLVQRGWGAALGYPGIVPCPQGLVGDEVAGWIFTSPQLPEQWDRLDAFEGSGYQRVTTLAKRADGSMVPVQIYAITPEQESF